MGKLTADQRTRLRASLFQSGLTFEPLLDEIIDHVACDLEDQIQQGQTFELALEQLITQLPEKHFQTIQLETMETIGKRFTLSRSLSFAAVGLFFVSIIFKLMHLQYSEQLLLVSFGLTGAALMVGSLSGINTYTEKKGVVRILAVIASILLLMVAYSFKMLHLRGADYVIMGAIGMTLISLLVNTVYVYKNALRGTNLLTFLHEKYTPGIERFLLLLLIPIMAYKIFAIVTHADSFLGNIILIVVIFGAGLQFIALNWRKMESDVMKGSSYVTTMMCILAVCFTLPFLGGLLPIEVRLIAIVLFSVIAAWVTYTMGERKNILTVIIVCLIPLLSLAESLIRLGILSVSAAGIFFNIPLMLLLCLALFLTPKHTILQSYVLISLVSYVLEYPLHGAFASH
ncbi:MAG: hypothetical protein WKF87_18750 [Chryseolinea sp.]